jgi:hypothetical protein
VDCRQGEGKGWTSALINNRETTTFRAQPGGGSVVVGATPLRAIPVHDFECGSAGDPVIGTPSKSATSSLI